MDFMSTFIIRNSITDINFPSITLSDVMDILIVAFIIYNLTAWVRETRAWTLFKGILILFCFGILAVLLRLTTILWILQNTLSAAFLAFIIIFQPELRKALEKLGKGSVSLPFSTQQSADEKCSAATFDEILDAVAIMSSKKTGALILIEQYVPLGDFLSTGIKIDGAVTSQLILNIFEHNTPLHDGAMIIRNNKIAAASCFLPLTDSKISMELGTRHRAALGASELSDAFVIIVSEETGDISACKAGELYRKRTKEQLKRLYFGEESSTAEGKGKKKGKKQV